MADNATMEALGMIETRGLVGMIEASDAMAKGAKVRLLGYEKIGSGLVTTLCRGEVGAGGAGVEGGGSGGEEGGEPVSRQVNPGPQSELGKIFEEGGRDFLIAC